MATVPHVISGLGLRKFQADGFLLTRVYRHSQSPKFHLLLTSLALIFVWQPTEQTLTCYSTVVWESRRFQNLTIYTGMKDRTSRHVVSIPALYSRYFGNRSHNRETYLPSWTMHIIWHTYVTTHKWNRGVWVNVWCIKYGRKSHSRWHRTVTIRYNVYCMKAHGGV